WQLKGYRDLHVPESATRRMLRACLENRRMSAPVVGRSVRLAPADKGELDHVIPRSVIVDALLQLKEPSEHVVQELLERLLVCAELTNVEHRIDLKPWSKRMPDGWQP